MSYGTFKNIFEYLAGSPGKPDFEFSGLPEVQGSQTSSFLGRLKSREAKLRVFWVAGGSGNKIGTKEKSMCLYGEKEIFK
jgi:hypothetical protein